LKKNYPFAKQLLLLLSIFTCSIGFAQREANIWYFGNKAGLDFTNGTPVTIYNAQLNTIEGCTSLSDNQGDLLFYTNGQKVWNKNHQIMANGTGLFGDLSSSQAAVIVPKPGSSSIYYIFTSNPFDIDGGLRYSEVDMAPNSNCGEVTNKNIMLHEPTCEKISVVRHANGVDLWLVSHQYGNDAFIAHLITEDGISMSPVISNSGLTVLVDDDKANAIGYMKISPDGSKLIACHTYLLKAEVFDFDNATGQVSNPEIVSDEGIHVYGAEFSTDSKVLYIATVDEKKLFQYDLNAADISNSKILISTFNDFLGALQLAPDGRIYLAMAETDKLSVIGNPENLGTDCGLETSTIDLGGRMCFLGLPSFNASLFNNNIKIENTCAASQSQFTVSTGQPIDSVVWDFGDGTPTSNDMSPLHTYASAGNYTVTATATNTNCTLTKTKNITIIPAPFAQSIPEQNLCIVDNQVYDLSQNDNAILNGQSPDDVSIAYFASYFDAENNVNALANDYILNPGSVTLSVRVENLDGCSTITEFIISCYLQPTATMPSDYTICENFPYNGTETISLALKDDEILDGQDNTVYYVTYHQNSADAENGLNNLPDMYTNSSATETIYARVQNDANSCHAVTNFVLNVSKQPMSTTITDFSLCDDNTRDGFAPFDLETKDAEALGEANDSSFNVTYHVSTEDAENNASAISGLYTNVSNPQIVYARIENGEGSCRTITPLRLIVKTDCAFQGETFTYPKFFTPNSDGYNDVWQVKYSNPILSVSIAIFDRNGKFLKNMECSDSGWDGNLNGQPVPANDYWFIVTDNKNGQIFRGHFSLMR